MHLDQIENIEDTLFDVIVIGSGPASAGLINVLNTSGAKILIIEAGDINPDTNTDQFFKFFENNKEVNRGFSLSWQIGGTSNLWAGRCAMLEPFDVSPENGWPFNFDEIKEDYRRAADFLKLPINSTKINSELNSHGSNEDSFNKIFNNPSELEKKSFFWGNENFSAKKYFLSICKKNENIQLLKKTRALYFKGAPNKIESIVVNSYQNRLIELRAKYFVCGCGGIETPRLLLNSLKINNNLDFGNEELIGSNFATHPKLNVGVLHLKNPVKLNNPLFTDLRLDDGFIGQGIGLLKNRQKSKILLNHYLQLNPRFEKYGIELLEHIKASKYLVSTSVTPKKKSIATKLRSIVDNTAISTGRVFFNILGRIGIFKSKTTLLTIRAFFDQFPSDSSKITLIDDLDPYGMQKASVNWSFSKKDLEDISNFLAYFKKTIESKKVGVVEYYDDEMLNPKKVIGIHSHFIGTLRMGLDPRTSVTDIYGKIHTKNNLYIIGSSVFPSYGFANPVFTIVALSLRTGRHILDQLNGSQKAATDSDYKD